MMRMKLAAGWVVLQVAFLSAWAAREETRFLPGRGTSILVRVEPVDPRDLLRGQFIRLSFPFSRIQAAADTGRSFESGDEVWTVLAPKGGFHEPVRCLAAPPAALAPGEVLVRGRVDGWRIVYGIEEYYVPEGTPTPNPRDLTVRLRIGDDFAPRLEEVLLHGRSWP